MEILSDALTLVLHSISQVSFEQSPLMNGVFTRNINTGLTLQDDVVTMIYQPLLKTKTNFALWSQSKV